MEQQSPLTTSKVHNALNKTFKGKTTKGYCWLKAHFPTSRLEECDDEMLQRMLECLVAKRKQEICPYHARIHKPVERKVQQYKLSTPTSLQSASR